MIEVPRDVDAGHAPLRLRGRAVGEAREEVRLPDLGILADDVADGLGHGRYGRAPRERVPQPGPMPPQRAADARRERALRAVVLARVPPSHFDRTLRVDLCGNQIYGAFVLNRRVDLHAIDATPARWRGNVGSSPPDGASAATSSPRNDLVTG